ncbi:MAG: MBL fold metallo-hydrolase [Candidatus Bathyarchaeota archaeon]|nr:MBL fold metallo-hydrolase [Candidatus Bathyarchaeota archaeon]
MLRTKMFMVGVLSTNCYVVYCKDTKEAAVIDPGFCGQTEAKEVFDFIESRALKLKYIVNTHGHPDHTCGNGLVKDKYHVPICIHQADAYMLGESGKETARYFGFKQVSPPADVLLHNGDSISVGEVTLKVVDSPGHSPGGVVFLAETEVFTGDTLFAGSIGRTDFPGSSQTAMQESLKKLATLSDYYEVYPGHGPTTTISQEKRVNPFLRGLT